MILALLFLVYLATMAVMLMFFFSVRTSVTWYFAKTPATHEFDFSAMLGRVETYDEEIGLKSYAEIRHEDDSYIIAIVGYPEIVFDDKTDIAAQVSAFPGASSSERISYYGLELARMFLGIHNSKGCQLAHKIGITILHHWFSNRVRFGTDPFAWYATVVSARRLNCIICIAYLPDNDGENEKLRTLLTNEIRACEKHINKRYTYDWATNHGLMDDNNVLAGNYILGTTNNALTKPLRSIARLDYFVSDDGVVLEPATSYWFMIKNYLSKIIKVQELSGIEIDKSTSSKFEALERWLAFASVNGLYSRIGDTSGANAFTPPHKYQYDQDGVFVWCTDTGLCYFNAVDQREVRAQMFLNSQYCPPLVHAHQDALAINLISDGIVWINSPGYFSPSMKDYGVNIRSVDNQSTVWCPAVGYQPNCRVQSVESNDERTRVCASVDLADGCTLTRIIDYESNSGAISITDETSNHDVVQSTFLFDDSISAELVDGKCILRHQNNEVLELAYQGDNAQLEEGNISYERNKMLKSTKLVLSGTKNSLTFTFTQPKQSVVNIPSPGHPYNSRKKLSAPFPEKLRKKIVPFHFRRIRRLMFVVTAVAFAIMMATLVLAQ